MPQTATPPGIETPPVDPGDAHGAGATAIRVIDPTVVHRDEHGQPVVQTFPPPHLQPIDKPDLAG